MSNATSAAAPGATSSANGSKPGSASGTATPTPPDPLTPPTPAGGSVTAEKLDKAAEWAAYAALGECARRIGEHVAGAAVSPVTGRPAKVLIVDLPLGADAAGPIAYGLQQRQLELDRAAQALDGLLKDLANRTTAALQLAQSSLSMAVPPSGAKEAMPLPGPVPVEAAFLSTITGIAGIAGGLGGAVTALPALTANLGAAVSFVAATLAFLRADYTITGYTVEVAEQALRIAVAGALAQDGRADVYMLDLADVGQAKVLAAYDDAVRRCEEVKAKAKALAAAAQFIKDRLDALDKQQDRLQTGGQPTPPQKDALDARPALAMSTDALRTLQLQITLAVEQANTQAASFDAYAQKLTAAPAAGQLAPLVLAVLHETVTALHPDYLLHLKLHSVAGETTAIGKWLFWFGGGLILTGHATTSYVLSNPETGQVQAGGMIGASAAVMRGGSAAQFSAWESTTFTAPAPAPPADSPGEVQQ